jgi:dimethylargininase
MSTADMPDAGFSYRFTDAIARKPGDSVASGLREVDQGAPSPDLFRTEHRAYIDALERAGVKVTVLDALEKFPDSVFIEDAALCLPGISVVLRPGTPSRTGEASRVFSDLQRLGHEVVRNDSEGFIDGGDILVTESDILVGLSRRTDRAGFRWLKSVLQPRGYSVLAVHTPEEVLHFKSDCSLVDEETVLATSRLAGADCFSSYRVLTVPSGEEAAANSIRVNDTVLVPAGFPSTAELLAREHVQVDMVSVSQAALLDGGLSCMSLRYSRL